MALAHPGSRFQSLPTSQSLPTGQSESHKCQPRIKPVPDLNNIRPFLSSDPAFGAGEDQCGDSQTSATGYQSHFNPNEARENLRKQVAWTLDKTWRFDPRVLQITGAQGAGGAYDHLTAAEIKWIADMKAEVYAAIRHDAIEARKIMGWVDNGDYNILMAELDQFDIDKELDEFYGKDVSHSQRAASSDVMNLDEGYVGDHSDELNPHLRPSLPHPFKDSGVYMEESFAAEFGQKTPIEPFFETYEALESRNASVQSSVKEYEKSFDPTYALKPEAPYDLADFATSEDEVSNDDLYLESQANERNDSTHSAPSKINQHVNIPNQFGNAQSISQLSTQIMGGHSTEIPTTTDLVKTPKCPKSQLETAIVTAHHINKNNNASCQFSDSQFQWPKHLTIGKLSPSVVGSHQASQASLSEESIAVQLGHDSEDKGHKDPCFYEQGNVTVVLSQRIANPTSAHTSPTELLFPTSENPPWETSSTGLPAISTVNSELTTSRAPQTPEMQEKSELFASSPCLMERQPTDEPSPCPAPRPPTGVISIDHCPLRGGSETTADAIIMGTNTDEMAAKSGSKKSKLEDDTLAISRDVTAASDNPAEGINDPPVSTEGIAVVGLSSQATTEANAKPTKRTKNSRQKGNGTPRLRVIKSKAKIVPGLSTANYEANATDDRISNVNTNEAENNDKTVSNDTKRKSQSSKSQLATKKKSLEEKT